MTGWPSGSRAADGCGKIFPVSPAAGPIVKAGAKRTTKCLKERAESRCNGPGVLFPARLDKPENQRTPESIMTLHELKILLREHGNRLFQLRLPDGSPVPVSFHVTEVGRVSKTFIDCGGTLRESTVCQLQVWIGEDVDHRLEAGKAAAILEKAKAFLPDESIPVEIEYEDRVISQYTIEGHESREDAVILNLAHKHTACLAPELCKVPVSRFSIDPAPRRGASRCC